MNQDLTKLNDREYRALTGIDKNRFEALVPLFAQSLQDFKEARYQEYKEFFQRRSGGGAKGILKTAEMKLFFVLHYLKIYPSFDALGFTFGMKGKNAHENLYRNIPILEACLESLQVLPARKFSSVEEFITFFKEEEELLIDATERAYHRKKEYEEQKKHYNGKKKDIPIKIPSSAMRIKRYSLSVRLW